MNTQILHGDALEQLRGLPDASVDAVVTDPPYGLEFMGKDWDKFTGNGFRRAANPGDAGRDDPFGRTSRTSPEYFAGTPFQMWCTEWATECLRVLKPGGHLLAFGGTRTYHRLAAGIEDAGLELRDSLTWLYGSGFPKSLDVSKAIDRAAGAEREVVGRKTGRAATPIRDIRGGGLIDDRPQTYDASAITAPATDAARQWQGWGSALKPASEPIVVARKPLSGTVAANVQTHGTGALNIDGCRVVHSGDLPSAHTAGRWPTNVVLSHASAADGSDACADGCVDGCPVAELDGQSGLGKSSSHKRHNSAIAGAVYENPKTNHLSIGHADTGGASRFFPTFRYQAKAPARERVKVDGVAHPTVKPLALLRWLVRLVTPPGGVVLDPFAGSGTTGEAAKAEGFAAILIEREAEYLPLIEARLAR